MSSANRYYARFDSPSYCWRGAINGWVGHDYHYWYDVYNYSRWREWKEWGFDFVATIWVMYNGGKAPPTRTYVASPGRSPRADSETASLEQLIAMKRFFAQQFRPNWTPQQLQEFIKPQEDRLRALLAR